VEIKFKNPKLTEMRREASMLSIPPYIERLRALGACQPAIKWAETQPDAKAAWNACENPAWLFWLAPRIGATHQQIVLAACACARTVSKYIPEEEERPLMAIEAAEAWARGEVSIEAVRIAARAAVDALYDARAVDAALAASHAAIDAARAAAYVAEAAARAAACAGEAGAYAAEAAARAADAEATRRVMCDKIREIISLPEDLERFVSNTSRLPFSSAE
jgi:hypothetical protein